MRNRRRPVHLRRARAMRNVLAERTVRRKARAGRAWLQVRLAGGT